MNRRQGIHYWISTSSINWSKHRILRAIRLPNGVEMILISKHIEFGKTQVYTAAFVAVVGSNLFHSTSQNCLKTLQQGINFCFAKIKIITCYRFRIYARSSIVTCRSRRSRQNKMFWVGLSLLHLYLLCNMQGIENPLFYTKNRFS